jgi:hypothetical protein
MNVPFYTSATFKNAVAASHTPCELKQARSSKSEEKSSEQSFTSSHIREMTD